MPDVVFLLSFVLSLELESGDVFGHRISGLFFPGWGVSLSFSS